MQKYQKYFEEFLLDNMQPLLSKEFLIGFIKIFDLLVILCFVSHFFASLWLFIGYYEMLDNSSGWIYHSHVHEVIQLELNYWSYYTTAIYWVIATFTSVGYGDIRGYTDKERFFQIAVEMIGIAFYGYMIGTFQMLFKEIATQDSFDAHTETLDYWLMSVGKARG